MALDRLDRPNERWQQSKNPGTLLQLVRQRGFKGSRKFRLVAAACCRRVWGKFDAQHRSALEVIERYADGEAKYNEMRLAVSEMRMEGYRMQPLLVEAARRDAAEGVDAVVSNLLGVSWGGPPDDLEEENKTLLGGGWFDKENWQAECASICQLIRESFAHVFAPVKIPKAWRTETVLQLAEGAYSYRDATDATLESLRLAILADALEDAGCDDPRILNHLRSSGPHVRGCWALDLVLERPA